MEVKYRQPIKILKFIFTKLAIYNGKYPEIYFGTIKKEVQYDT